MASFWRKLFNRGDPGPNGGGQRDTDNQGIRTARPHRSLTRLFVSQSGVQENLELQPEVPNINCQESIHYPIYDPDNPSHNPRARRRRHDTTKTKSLRRAGSSIKAIFRRPGLLPELEGSNADSQGGHNVDDNSRSQPGDLEHSTQSDTPESHSSVGTGITSANTNSSCQSPAYLGLTKMNSRPDSQPDGQSAVEGSSCSPSHRLDGSLGPLPGKGQEQCRLKGGDDNIRETVTHIPSYSPTTPPSIHGVRKKGHIAHGEAGPSSQVIASRIESAGRIYHSSAGATANEADNRRHQGDLTSETRGSTNRITGGSDVASYSHRGCNVSSSKTSHWTSVIPKTHSLVVDCPSKVENDGPRGPHLLSPQDVRKTFLEIPRQRPSLYRKASFASTEIDSEFGIEIYRTTRRECSPLMQPWLSSTSISHQEPDEKSPALETANCDAFRTCHANAGTGEFPAAPNFSHRNPATGILPVWWKGDLIDTQHRCQDDVFPTARAENRFENTHMDKLTASIGMAGETNLNCANGHLASSKPSMVPQAIVIPEPRVGIDAHSNQFTANTPGSQLSSGLSNNSVPDVPMSQSKPTWRYAVEAIERLPGFELPDSDVAQFQPEDLHPVSFQRYARSTGGYHGSSSGSNESGQSDPSSSIASTTVYSSATSVYDSPVSPVKEGIEVLSPPQHPSEGIA